MVHSIFDNISRIGVSFQRMRFPWSKFSDSRLKKLSDIYSDLGIVLVASVVLPVILGTFDVGLFITGSFLAVTFFSISLWLSK